MTSDDIVKQTRQILQLAEYIGVDYSEAVTAGNITNPDEFAEMQQFASIIIEKTNLLANDIKKFSNDRCIAITTSH